jgi:DNA-binding NtrC family response regulator
MRELERVEGDELSGDSLLEASSVAVPVYLQAGLRESAESWFSRAVRGARCEAGKYRAELLGFSIAVASADAERAARHLDAAAPAVGLPEIAWRWHRARADLAMRTGRAVAARAHLRLALQCRRRSLSPVAAADLWVSLASARRESGDLAGAERALRHAVRLQRDAIGSEGWIRALAALADVRLRRGGPAAAEDVVIALNENGSLCENARLDLRLAIVRTRHELARGRANAAVEVAESTLEAVAGRGECREREELRVLLARARGWQGSVDEARKILGMRGVCRPGILEPEEWPALWILAGCREEALRETGTGPAAAAWHAALEGRRPTNLELELAGELGQFRYARLIVDLEAAAAGRLPRQRVREAARILRTLDADAHARRLEDGENSQWKAVATFLSTTRRDLDVVVRLFDDSGYGNVRLLFRPLDGASELIMDRDGGDQDLIIEVDEGTLELWAPAIDSTLRVLAGVVAPVLGAALQPARLSRGASHRSELPISGMVGESRELREAVERLRRLAPGETPVLILGETGTGKELAARGVHAGSARASGAFVPFNCAAASGDLLLSDLFGHVRGSFTGAVGDRTGVFESARGGTVFLDEVGDLPLRAQGFLLRVLQEGEVRRVGETRARRVDVRVVSATHTDLQSLVQRGEFRADLFYRLGGARVELPPLRRRSGDIPLLARHFLDRTSAGSSRRLTSQALAALRRYGWPGNIRELENVLAVAAQVADGGPIRLEHLELPASRPARATGYHERVRDYRRRLVREAMIASDGNGAEAARCLGVTRQALSYLVRSLEIDIRA